MTDNTLKPCPPDDLRPWGWAPGDYSIYCMDCGHTVSRMMAQGAKRSTRCKDHAVEAWRNTRAVAHPPAAPDTVTLDRALVEEVLGALNAAIPDGVSIGDRKWPDSLIIPIDTTLGELRLIKSTLTKLTEALK